MKKKTNSFCYWIVLRMTQPSSLMAVQHWVCTCIWPYSWISTILWLLLHTLTHTETYAHTRAHLLTGDVSTHTCRTNVFIPSFSPSISCAVPFMSVASAMIQASGIARILYCEHFVRNPKQMNERTRTSEQRRRTLKLTIVLAYTTELCLWCHAQNLMAAHCF